MADFDAVRFEPRALPGTVMRPWLGRWLGIRRAGLRLASLRVAEVVRRRYLVGRAGFGRQKEWGRALQQAGERRGDLDGRQVLLALDLLDERSEYLAFAASHRIGEALLEFENALLVDVRDAG